MRCRKLCQWQFLRGVMEEHNLERVARILGANQMRQRQGHFLCRRKPIFAVKNHRMGTVKHDHGGAGRLVVALLDVQIAVLKVERQFESLALNRR